MANDLQQLLRIPADRLDAINEVLFNPDTKIVQGFLDVVAKYGTPEEINRKATEARKLENLYAKVRQTHPEYMTDLEWLANIARHGNFISIDEYRQNVLGDVARTTSFADDSAVTLEVSALQYFPWVREMVERALEEADPDPRAVHQGPQDEGTGTGR